MFFLHGVSERHADYGDPLPMLIQEALTKRQKPLPYIRKGFWGNFLGENEKLWTSIEQEFAEEKYRNPIFDESQCFKYKSFKKGAFSKFVADAFSYLNSSTGSQIRQLIATQLKEALSFYHEATEIYFIAHSLGTAILWDTLFSNRFQTDDAALAIRSLLTTKIALKGIVTMGSPIPFVNMTLGTTLEDVEKNLSHYLQKDRGTLPWFNFIHASDIIAYPLRPLLKKVNPQLMTLEDIYLTNDISAIETKLRQFIQSSPAQLLIKMNPDLEAAISSIPAVVGTPTGHLCYWKERVIAEHIAKIIYPHDPLEIANTNMREIVSRIQSIAGMTEVRVELPDLKSEIITQFQIKDNSGSLILAKNMLGVHHVKIANQNGDTLYFGYVGWLHIDGLCKTIRTIQDEFS